VRDLRNKNQKGFTLIELLVVIAIIGLLASVVLLALNSARSKSRDSKRLADIRQIATAWEMFFNDKNSFPTTSANATIDAINGSNSSLTNYVTPSPTAPTPADGNCAAVASTASGANPYFMLINGNGNVSIPTYTITFCLGSLAGTYAAGPHTLTQAGIQ
jgi:prepilin-type N-terminal cleavage/methylation domain-containing protein